MNRRVFVGGVMAGVTSGCAQTAKSNAGDIPMRTLGKTGQKLTLVGPAGGRLEMVSFEQAKAVIRRAAELGVNYFDNAHLYWNGRSEQVYGEVLPPYRKNIFITTKSAERTRAGAERNLEQSLRSMKTDYIDLWQIHQVSEMGEVEQIFAPGGAIEAFEAAKKAGKCRFIGFTGHQDPKVHLEMLRRYDRYDTILMPLNPADPSYLSFEKDVLPVAVQRGMGIQAMKSTANGKLLTGFSLGDCLSYVLSLPVHCVAMGATTVAQIEDDVRIAKGFQPLAAQAMETLRRRASRMAGPRLEDWKVSTDRSAVIHQDA